MRELILEEARSWIGTPFYHQASLKGVGVDCVGLIRGVGLSLDLFNTDIEAGFREFSAYSRTPNPRKMEQGMRRFLVPVEDPLPGDIPWIQWREDLPMHVAILGINRAGRRTLIHALSEIGSVVEHGLDELWESRITSWWRYPRV